MNKGFMFSHEDISKFFSYDKKRYKLIITSVCYQLIGDYHKDISNELEMTVALYDRLFITPYAQWKFVGVSDIRMNLGGGIDDLSAFSIEDLEGQWQGVRYKVKDAEQSEAYFFYCKDAELKFL